jgi:protein SCO1/2
VGHQVAGGPAARTGGWALAASVLAVAAIGIACVVFTVVVTVRRHQIALPGRRPPGVPAGLADLMGLRQMPARTAPGFRLTDQDDQDLPLSGFRGRVVVLGFMDSQCRGICPVVSQEFIDAYRDLGHAAGDVVFVAINVNVHDATVQDVRDCSAEHQLTTIPDWYFFTGSAPDLESVWREYGIRVRAPGHRAAIAHNPVIYFIAPDGAERYIAAPAGGQASVGAARLPPGELAGWGQGIALVARSLTP